MKYILQLLLLLALICNLSAKDNEINLQFYNAKFEPADGRVIHGVCTMTYESGDPVAPYLSALNDLAIQPFVRGMFFTIPGERGPANSFKGLETFLKTADSVGFMPEISLFFMDKVGSTDSLIAVSTQHDWIIDSIIVLCRNYGKRMTLRIGGEFNGSGPGWNGGGYHPYLYVTMFRKIVDMFTAKGMRDSIATIWCYEPDAADDFDVIDGRGAKWYPGDSYVDWFGLDVFDAAHFDQSLPDSVRGSISKKGKSERFLAMARRKMKPVYMSETSAKGVNISADSQDGIDDWNNWFAKFWEFIDVHKEIKGFNYINANWPTGAYPNWGDARIQNSNYVTDKYREEMRKPKYIHLPFAQSLPTSVTLVTPMNNFQTDTSNVMLLWNKLKDISNYHLQVIVNNNVKNMQVNDSSLSDTSYIFKNMQIDSSYSWHVRAKNSAGWGSWSEVRNFKRIKIPDSLFSAVPIAELTEQYKGFEGGLYQGISNTPPMFHLNNGIDLANSVKPLNKSGLPDLDSGKIVLLSVGMSNCTQEFSVFKQIADTFAIKNPKLIIVDGAQGGQTAAIIRDPNAAFWKVIDTARLPQGRVNNLQVQVIWLKEANANPTQPFPQHATMLRDDLKTIVKFLLNKFPNLKLVFLSSRTYGGYATTKLNPEPYAYESGFSVKWLIEMQTTGDTSLSYNGTPHPAPWLGWGPYLWANGPNPRQDNALLWLIDDFGSDGTHPSNKGRMKVANLLLDFFSNEPTCKPWFLKQEPGAVNDPKDQQPGIQIMPNPAQNNILINIQGNNIVNINLIVTDILGKSLYTMDYLNLNSNIFNTVINGLSLPSGTLFFTFTINGKSFTKQVINLK